MAVNERIDWITPSTPTKEKLIPAKSISQLIVSL